MTLLLIIIYLAFISLGLPDSLLGSAWPSIYSDIDVSIDSAGIISMIISGGTIISSLFSDRLIRRFGTGTVTLVSVFMTAVSLLGFSFSHGFITLCACAVPLGLGAGSVDAALNNFVARNYKAKHMSWLHCFWGIGASIGPVIMSYSLLQPQSWSMGYRIIGIIQFILIAVLLLSLPLWKKVKSPETEKGEDNQEILAVQDLIALPGAKQALIVFFCYCAIESVVGLWGSSYLVSFRKISEATAASWVSLYYFGITLGRFFSGFLAIKLKHKQMVQLGQTFIAIGAVVLLLPLTDNFALAGLFIIGLGCAPVYPSLLHETPRNFGEKYSQSIMGVQMASAYIGTTFIPPLFGLIGANISYGLLPFFILALLIIMIFMVTLLYKKISQREE